MSENTTETGSDTGVSSGASGGTVTSIADLASLLESTINSLNTRLASLESQVSTVKQASVDSQIQAEHVIDVGDDEATKRAIVADGHNWEANRKALFDGYNQLAIERARQSQDLNAKVNAHFDDLMADLSLHRKNLINQSEQNKRGSHNDQNLSVDRIWNVDEVSDLTAKSGVEADAVVTALAKVLADMVNQNSKTA